MRLRTICRALLLDLLVLLAGCASNRARAVESVGVTVSSLGRSVAFYRDVLSFEVVASSAGAAVLRLGDERLELIESVDPLAKPVPADSRSNDLWFQHVAIIVRDMDAAYARLQEHGVVPISRGPQRLPDWNPNAGGIRAFYFRDPDRHALELLELPEGKGDSKWHRPTDRLFLGIDHTAIAVSDTERSLAFYRDQLGLRVAGASDNHGPEQDALSGVPGAHVRITSLRGESGPGVEFLQYLEPHDGRRLPLDAQPQDLSFWKTVVRVEGERWPSITSNERPQYVRDPDGHAVEIATSR